MIFLRIALAVLSTLAFLTPLAIPNLAPFAIARPAPKIFSQTVNPEPVEIYCPGGIVRQGGESGTNIGEFEVIANSQVQVFGNNFSPEDIPSSIENGMSITSTSTDAQQSTLDLVASSLAAVSSKRLAGLAALNCAQPVSRGILLAGDSQVGTETILIVSNPQEIETVVEVQVLGLEGQPTETLVLAAGEQKYVSLASLSGEASKFAVQFESSAGAVSVVMQQRTISGLSPTGVELSDWVSEPTKEQVFPVVKVLGSSLAPEKSLGQPILRIYNPTEFPSSSKVYLVSASTSKTISVSTEPGQISETTLDLSDGDWSAFISSDQEIFAAVRNPVFSSRADFEWLNPANAIQKQLAIASWPNSQLHLANSSSQSLRLQISGVGEVMVPANSRRTLSVQPGQVVLESDSEIFAALTVLNDSGFAVIEPRENKNFGADLQVVIY
jgi:hypothetical protein